MLRAAFAGQAGVLPLVLLVCFAALFAGILIYVLTDRRRDHLRRMETLPLDEDDRHGR
jgi:hypothetical protein